MIHHDEDSPLERLQDRISDLEAKIDKIYYGLFGITVLLLIIAYKVS